MNKEVYEKVLVICVLTLLILSLAGTLGAAKKGGSKGGSSGGSSGGSGSKSSDSSTKTVQKEETTYDYIDENQNTVKVTLRTETKTKEGEVSQKIKVRGVEADSDLDLEPDKGKIKARLSNGNQNEIKIMPDTASEKAIEKIKTNKDISIRLKEVGKGNDLSVVYDFEGNRTIKFIGLFKVRSQLMARVDAETGEIIEFETPWWYFFAGKEIIIPKCNPENLGLCRADECEGMGGYWYDDFCNSEPQIVCSTEHLELCLNLEECEFVGGFWYNNICNAEPQIINQTQPPPVNISI